LSIAKRQPLSSSYTATSAVLPHRGSAAQRATLCYMDTVTHREMRNRSAEILRRVEAGESVRVTNNGHPAAIIVPVGGNTLDGLISRGEARPARTGMDGLLAVRRAPSEIKSSELIKDSRGRW
jgi:prevent-host-death family protein